MPAGRLPSPAPTDEVLAAGEETSPAGWSDCNRKDKMAVPNDEHESQHQRQGTKLMAGYPTITGTQFGAITLGKETYDKDIYIRADGTVQKRKKKLAKQAYGTSHKIGPDELKKLCKGGPEIVFIGTGQQGLAELTEEGRRYLEKHGIDYAAMPTPDVIASYNKCRQPKAALIHITC
jgi:hypothetical protein